jgi:hypothetical protein
VEQTKERVSAFRRNRVWECASTAKKSQYMQDSLIASRSSVGAYDGTVSTTTERLSGAERHVVCKVCLLKKATRHALLVGLGTAVGAFFGIGILFGSTFHSVLPFILLSLTLGFVALIAAELAGLFSQRHRTGPGRNRQQSQCNQHPSGCGEADGGIQFILKNSI